MSFWKKNQTKILLIVGLFAAYSSTSFAADAKKAPEAVSKVNKSGQKTNGKGGGQAVDQKSCLAGAQSVKLKADQVGLKADELVLNTTERGPELTVCGKTKIATNPRDFNPKVEPNGQPARDKKFGWCIINEDLARTTKAPDPKKFTCRGFDSPDGPPPTPAPNGETTVSQDFEIPCEGGKIKASIITRKDKDENIIDSKIQIRGPDKDKDTNFLEIRAKYDQTSAPDADPVEVKGKFTIAEKPANGASADQEAGAFHYPIEGKLRKSDPNDDEAEKKFQSCKVESEDKGPKNENETAKAVDVALAGSCIVYRGATVPLISERYSGCNTTVTSTESISMMHQDRKKGEGQQ